MIVITVEALVSKFHMNIGWTRTIQKWFIVLNPLNIIYSSFLVIVPFFKFIQWSLKASN
jgi:hypothetical protein